MLKSHFSPAVGVSHRILVLAVLIIFLVPQSLFAQAPPPTSQQQQQQTQQNIPVKSAAQTKAAVQNQPVSASGQIQSPSSSQTTTQFMTSNSPLSASAPQPVQQSSVSKATPLRQQAISTNPKLAAVKASVTNTGKQQPLTSQQAIVKTPSPAITVGQPVAISGQLPPKSGQQTAVTVGSVQTISGTPGRTIASSPASAAPIAVQAIAATPLQPAPGLQNVPAPNVPSVSLQPAPSTPVAAPLTLSAPSNVQTMVLATPTQFPQGFLSNVKGGDEITKGIQNYWTNIAGIQPTGAPTLITAAQTILGGYNVSISTGNPPTNYFSFKLVNKNGSWLVTESVQSDAKKNILEKEVVAYDAKGRLEARKTEQYFQGQLSAVYSKKYDQGQLVFESENLIGSGGQPSRLTTKEYLNGQLTRERQDYTDAKGQKLRAFEKRYENGKLTADFYADNTGVKSLTLYTYDKKGNLVSGSSWTPIFNGTTNVDTFKQTNVISDPNVPGGQYTTEIRYENGRVSGFILTGANGIAAAGLTANGWVNYSPGGGNALIKDIDQYIADSSAKLQIPGTAIDLKQKPLAFPKGFTL